MSASTVFIVGIVVQTRSISLTKEFKDFSTSTEEDFPISINALLTFLYRIMLLHGPLSNVVR